MLRAGGGAARWIGVSALVAGLALAGCSGTDGSGERGRDRSTGRPGPSARAGSPSSADPGRNRPLLSEPMSHKYGPAHVELLALSRTSGSVVTARFRVVNDGTGRIDLTGTLAEEPLPGQTDPNAQGDSLSASGIGLLDPVHNQLSLPLSTQDGACLCSKMLSRLLGPGQSTEVYAMFPAPPPEVTAVTVVVPLTVPFQDVRLGSGSVGNPPDLGADPATATLRPPRILAVSSQADGTAQSVVDTGENRSLRLSSDVLFALNKADLTDRAAAVLAAAAEQIDASTATTVSVDGYTDTTGNDAINGPLSRRRAEAVAGRLQTLVTRPAVTFRVAGHGSADPVASNDDEAGRRRNRRVTVAFNRPKPGLPTPSPQASGSTPASPGTGAPYRLPDGSAPALGTATFPGGAGGGGPVATVNGLHRDASGLTTLVWSMADPGATPVDVFSEFEIFYKLHGQFAPHRAFTVGGVLLVDPATGTRYYPLVAADGQCLCTTLAGEAKAAFNHGESSTYAAGYELPLGLGAVEIWFPWTKGGYTFVRTPAIPVG